MKRNRADMMNKSILSFVQEQNDNSDVIHDDSTFLKCAFSTLFRSRDFGSKSGAIIDSVYKIKESCLTADELNEHKECLTMKPLDAGFSKEDTSFEAFQSIDGWLQVPKFYGLHHWGMPCYNNTILGKDLNDNIIFTGNLKDIQEIAANKCIHYLSSGRCKGGMLVLPCGYGKTVVALYVAYKLKLRTLVLVHKSFLVQQWQERVKTFMPNASIGKIQRDSIDYDADFVIGMIQSISTRDYPDCVVDSFGLVIVDEAHHMSAPVFSKSLRKLKSAKTLALSATPERKDGLTDLLFWSMGEIIYRIERKPEELDVYVMIYNGGKKRELMRKDGQICLPKMITDIVSDNCRNIVLADIILKLYTQDRNIIILSDRIHQLHEIVKIMIEYKIEQKHIAFYIGTTPADEREQACSRRIIMSTFSMAKEGLDIPALDTLILATPKGDIEQSIGRIQRPYPNKKVPIVIDIVDPWSIFNQLRWKRGKHYKKMNYNVKNMMCNSEDFLL
jgi:superfamily II DNA or RNA helicase